MKNTVVTFQEAKDKGEKLSMLTAYDYSTARLIDEAGVNAILVGDSLGMVVLGYEDTLSVTMEDMIHHSAAVARGIKDTLLITDMPFMSYQTSISSYSSSQYIIGAKSSLNSGSLNFSNLFSTSSFDFANTKQRHQ